MRTMGFQVCLFLLDFRAILTPPRAILIPHPNRSNNTRKFSHRVNGVLTAAVSATTKQRYQTTSLSCIHYSKTTLYLKKLDK